MFNTWTHQPYLNGLPLVFTEMNWRDSNDDEPSSEAAYLVDFFTWLGRHGYTTPASVQKVRVAWFRGNNNPGYGTRKYLGLYGSSANGGGEKIPLGRIAHCPRVPTVQGHRALSFDFVALQHTFCF